MTRGILAATCALVIGIYAYSAQSGYLQSVSPNPADAYYNLLVQGFRAGQLSLKKDVPAGFAQLADPYDPAANASYLWRDNLLDLSYYQGRFYLYFGVTPAVILFWPFVALTGHYLSHQFAVVIFCALGFLASVGLLRDLWRRYFTDVSVGVVAACALGVGFGTGLPLLLSKSEVYAVAISCGYMLTMLALWAIGRALQQPRNRSAWLAIASLAYGLAVGARPSLLFGAIILLAPVAQARRERRPILAPLAAAIGPIMLIGSGLMVYNAMRFGDPFEFGMHYQIARERRVALPFFGLHHLWFNFRAYFLEPVRWTILRSPFVQGAVMPATPSGHGNVEGPFGVLTNIPLVWLALAAPLAWRNRSPQAAWALRWLAIVATSLFGIVALTLCLYYCTAGRFEVEFLPALLLLALIGVLGLERLLANQPARRCAVRCLWGVLLIFSITFNLLACLENYALAHCYMGRALMSAGKLQDAISQYQQALRIEPDFAEVRCNLAVLLGQTGNINEAITQYELALRNADGFAEAHFNLAMLLAATGRFEEAVAQYERALRIKPDFAEAHYNLGVALERLGRTQEAVHQYEEALQLKPDLLPAQNALTRLRPPQ